MSDIFKDVEVKRITLERFTIAFKKYISRDIFLQDVQIESVIDDSIDALMLSLRAYCLGKKQQTAKAYFPSSWWQHLKRDHALNWFKRRFPVKETVFTYDAAKICPHINVKFPDNQQVHFDWIMEKP